MVLNVQQSFIHITYVDPLVVGRNVLQTLIHFNLRDNITECDCSLNENFGFLIQFEMKRLKLPNILLPVCNQAVQDYYGDCLNCRDGGFMPSILLFHCGTISYCHESFLTLLSISGHSFVLLFTTLILLLKINFTENFLIKILCLFVVTPPLPRHGGTA